MANNPQSSGGQFRPMAPTQQGQPFISVASQQFRPVGQGMPSSHVGMPAAQNQPLQFSQPIQQLPPWPSQPGPGAPSAQALSMPYVQQNRPLTSSQPQQTAPPLGNHTHGVGTSGIPISSPYGFAPSSFGLTQNSASALPQFPPMSQMHAPVVPVGGQPWLSSGSHGASLVPPVQPAVMQPSISSSSDSAVAVSGNSQQSLNDWQEHTASDGRRYYYNKRTKQSNWEKPFELMTPLEISWQVWRNLTIALYAHFEGRLSLSQGREHFVISILFIIGQIFM